MESDAGVEAVDSIDSQGNEIDGQKGSAERLAKEAGQKADHDKDVLEFNRIVYWRGNHDEE